MVRIVVAAIAAGLSLPGQCFAAEPLSTGMAIYAISLDPVKSGGMADLTGTLKARLERHCETYLSETDLSGEFVAPQGRRLPLHLTSRHEEDDTSLTFDAETRLDHTAVAHAKGTAARDTDKIAVALTKPEAKTFTINGDVLFPVAMIEAAIAAARSGETLDEFRIYDGTGSGEEVWTVSVLIGPVKTSGEDDEDAELFAAGLGFGEMPRWQMTMNYFPPSSEGAETPAFSTSMVVYENGFAQAAVYDLGQFAMRLKLVEFTPIAPEPCS